MLGTPTHLVAPPTLNGSFVGPAFVSAVIAIGIAGSVAYAFSTPSTEGPPLNHVQRMLAARFAFGLWTGLGCLAVLGATRVAASSSYSISIDGTFTGPTSVPEPGGVLFALTCLAWTAPFVRISWRRRRAWTALAAVAGAVAAAGIADLFAHPPDNFYTPMPPAALLLAMVAVGVAAAVLYDDPPAKFSRLNPRTWVALVQVFFGAWVVIGLGAMTVGLGLAEDVGEGAQEPGAMIFAAACLLWTLPYVVVASRRRTRWWIGVAAVSVAIALFGIGYLFVNPTQCRCD